MLKIDFSTLAAYRNCPNYFNLRYVHCLKPTTDTIHLDFGTLFHKALELIYTTKPLNFKECEAFSEIAYLTSHSPPDTKATSGFIGILHTISTLAATTSVGKLPNEAPMSLEHLLTLIVQYCRYHLPDLLEPTHFEVYHEMNLGNDVIFCGTMDMINKEGPIETKTAAWYGKFNDIINCPNQQAIGYVALARDFLKTNSISNVVFNGAFKNGWGLKSKPKESWPIFTEPEKLFRRENFAVTEADIEHWFMQIHKLALRIKVDIVVNDFDKPGPKACINCDLKKECLGKVDIDFHQKEIWKGFHYDR